MSWKSTIRSSRAPIPALRAATLIVALLLAFGCARRAPEGGGPAVPSSAGEVGSKAPNFELMDLSGKKAQLSDFTGKVVILDFWATWCGPCRAEVPDLVRLQSKYRDKGLLVVGLSLDAEGASAVKPFAEEFNVNYPMLLANADTARRFGGIIGIPTTFVLDRQGRIVKKFMGRVEQKTFEEAVQPLLAT